MGVQVLSVFTLVSIQGGGVMTHRSMVLALEKAFKRASRHVYVLKLAPRLARIDEGRVIIRPSGFDMIVIWQGQAIAIEVKAWQRWQFSQKKLLREIETLEAFRKAGGSSFIVCYLANRDAVQIYQFVQSDPRQGDIEVLLVKQLSYRKSQKFWDEVVFEILQATVQRAAVRVGEAVRKIRYQNARTRSEYHPKERQSQSQA